MVTMTISEARAALPAVLDRVEAGEEVTITRHGRAVAIVLRPEALRSRRRREVIERASWVRALLEDHGEEETPSAQITVERAEELVAAIRAGRDAR